MRAMAALTVALCVAGGLAVRFPTSSTVSQPERTRPGDELAARLSLKQLSTLLGAVRSYVRGGDISPAATRLLRVAPCLLRKDCRPNLPKTTTAQPSRNADGLALF